MKTELKKYLKNVDLVLIIAIFLIVSIGIAFVYTASYNMQNFVSLFTKQIVSIILGFSLLLIFSLINYNSYYNIIKYFYIFSILLLVLVLFFGKTVKGARSWFDFYFISFQPTELSRIFVILTFTVFIDKNIKNVKSFLVFIQSFLLFSPILILIAMQPDFGAILTFFPVIFGICFLSNMRKIYLFSILFFIFFVSIIPLIRTFFITTDSLLLKYFTVNWTVFSLLILAIFIYIVLKMLKINFHKLIYIYFSILAIFSVNIGFIIDSYLKTYQRNRLIAFLNPELDKLGAGYNIIQSKIAIGSGGLLGKGLKSGTQTQLGFVPERHTDFIFSVIGEESGFLLASFTILLYLLICYRIFLIAKNAKDRFGSLICSSFLILFSFFVILNIGFVLGLLPVTGVPLPLISYGGSSFIVTCIMLGIILNVGIERYAN
ncbi:MAG: rod shape-determining protein RodA [Elusimicrobiota bacterium]|jgi:rod shape determining protein RodA|nr:rod shape-determining protein RodA [Elusimicrobiota bacterium]